MVGTKISGNRYEELRRILQERRREIMSEVIDRMRDVRTEGNGEEATQTLTNYILDSSRRFIPYKSIDLDSTPHPWLNDECRAAIQMKAETLAQIDEALARLEQEAYGYCFECGGEISEQRLRALPFAVRCKDCEELHERTERRDQEITQRHGEFSLTTFMNSSN